MFKFFSTTKFKPRQFGYKPRFYDEEQEKMERRAKIRNAKMSKAEQTKSRLRREFGNYKSAEGKGKRGSLISSSSFRLLIIILLLSFASYFVLDNLLPKLMKNWFPEEDTESYEMLDEYYELRGWDNNGVPKAEKLQELGLENEGKSIK